MQDCNIKKNGEEKSRVTILIKRSKKDDVEVHTAMASRSSITVANNQNASSEAIKQIFKDNMTDTQGAAIEASDWIIDCVATDHICALKVYFTTM